MPRFLAKLSLSVQLTSVSMIVVLIASLGGAIGAFSLLSFGAHVKAFENVASEGLLASRLDSSTSKLRLNVREYLASHNPDDLKDARKYMAEARDSVALAQKAIPAPDRRANLEKVATALVDFEKGLARLDAVITQQNKIVADVLDKLGPNIRSTLADVIEGNIREGNRKATALAGNIQEDFLTARFYITKYILNSRPEDSERARSEFADIEKRLVSLGLFIVGQVPSLGSKPGGVQLPGQSAHGWITTVHPAAKSINGQEVPQPELGNTAVALSQILPLIQQYRDGFETLRKLIEERTTLLTLTLDKQGEDIGAWATAIRNSAVTSQALLSHNILASISLTNTQIIALLAIGFTFALLLPLANARNLSRRLSTLAAQMRDLALGNTNIAIPSLNEDHEIGEMAKALAAVQAAAVSRQRLEVESIQQRKQIETTRLQSDAERRKVEEAAAKVAEEQGHLVAGLAQGLARLARGDLTARLAVSQDDAFQQIKDDFNRMGEQINLVAARISESSTTVQGGMREISAGVVDLAERTEQQASALEQTAASMEEMSATVRRNASNAQQANQAATSTSELASNGGQIAGEAVAAMAKIEESSRQITEIVGLIEEIAFQTNILALNAAVEAARAGDAGRGFAVVANEVRALSQRSSQALKEIKTQILNSNTNVKVGVGLVKHAGDSLTEIVESVKRVAGLVAEIATASHQQSSGIDQVGRAITNMDQMTQQNAALVEETNAALLSAQAQMDELKDAVAFFKTKSGAISVAPRAAPNAQATDRPSTAAPHGRPAARRTGTGGAADFRKF